MTQIQGTNPHPQKIVDDGIAAARRELRDAVKENRPVRLASQFVGALGELQAEKVTGATCVSGEVNEYDLRGPTHIEVKATLRPEIKNVGLGGKICHEVCFVRFEQIGEELWCAEIYKRPRGETDAPKVDESHRTWLLKADEKYCVIGPEACRRTVGASETPAGSSHAGPRKAVDWRRGGALAPPLVGQMNITFSAMISQP